MVPSAEGAGFFQRQDIGRLLDHAKKFHRARRIRANVAKFVGREIAAEFAGMNSTARLRDGPRDLLRLIAARLDDPERNPFGRAWANAGHVTKLRDQVPKRGWIFRFLHERLLERGSTDPRRFYIGRIGTSAR